MAKCLDRWTFSPYPKYFEWVAICFIYSPCGNAAEARKIGETLLAERLVACVNILDKITSIYVWKGEPTNAQEAVLIAKTSTTHTPKAIKRIKQLHSYEIPSITAFTATTADTQWQNWLEQQLLPEPPPNNQKGKGETERN